jgi:hypothetical protein
VRATPTDGHEMKSEAKTSAIEVRPKELEALRERIDADRS